VVIDQYLDNWPEIGDTPRFFQIVLNKAKNIYDSNKKIYGPLFEAFGIPKKPFILFNDVPKTLSFRHFRLCHCDIHRKNCLLSNGKIWFLDWELALIADPVYDIAIHLHKMEYLPSEEYKFYSMLKEVISPVIIAGLDKDIEQYRNLECVKSIIVDTVRYHKQIHDKKICESAKQELVAKFAKKLQNTYELLGNNLLAPEEIFDKFEQYLT